MGSNPTRVAIDQPFPNPYANQANPVRRGLEMAKPKQKAEAVRLRIEERLSLREIATRLGVSKGTVSVWVRPHRLTEDEIRTRAAKRPARPLKPRGVESKFHQAVDASSWTRHQKGKVAEAAVLFRLILQGFHVFGSVFDGDKTDWLVEVPDGAVKKVQVKWASCGEAMPAISLRCSNGRGHHRAYTQNEFDFIVGYDLFTDTAYVWSWAEVAGKKSVSVHPQAAEAWWKLKP